MNSTAFSLDSQVRTLLTQADGRSAAELQSATGKSQPSISLALTRLGDAVYKIGAARSTRYALTQSILGLDARQAVDLAAPHADQGVFGSLVFLQGNRVHICGPRKRQWMATGALPWWLSTLQPQGYLGRQFARLRPDFAPDPDQWTLEQTLYMAVNHLSDPPGAFAMGPRRLETPITLKNHNRGQGFDHLADTAAQSLPTGSSAGGEQPKFLTQVGNTQVIVKFSPPRGTPFGERWHDLLHLEHLAGLVLRDKGVATAKTELVQTQRRTYLQSTRFDRLGRTGKRHVVAASSIHEAFVNTPQRHWVATCEALVARKLLAPEHLRAVASTYLFGQYIANTDMHFGNLSFFVDDVTQPVLVPTPVYDMLPMVWRPGVHGGELDAAPIPQRVQPAGFDTEAAHARTWAIDYWDRAARLEGLSPGLRRACARNNKRLRDANN